jgi:hypothetical protein
VEAEKKMTGFYFIKNPRIEDISKRNTSRAWRGWRAICDFLRREDELMTELMNHKRSTS